MAETQDLGLLASGAALFTGGVFIFSTFHWWTAAIVSSVLGVAVIVAWLWTGTAMIPEKPAKDVGCGLTLPLYASGTSSVGRVAAPSRTVWARCGRSSLPTSAC